MAAASPDEVKEYMRNVAQKAPDVGHYVIAHSSDVDELIELTQKGVADTIRKLVAEQPGNAEPGEVNMYAFKLPIILCLPAPVV